LEDEQDQLAQLVEDSQLDEELEHGQREHRYSEEIRLHLVVDERGADEEQVEADLDCLNKVPWIGDIVTNTCMLTLNGLHRDRVSCLKDGPADLEVLQPRPWSLDSLHVPKDKLEDAVAIDAVNSKLAIVEASNRFEHDFVPFFGELHVLDGVWELLDELVHPLSHLKVIDSRWLFSCLEIIDGHTLLRHLQVDQNWLDAKLIRLFDLVVTMAVVHEVSTCSNR